MSELQTFLESLSDAELARVLIEAGEIQDDETAKLAASIIASRKPKSPPVRFNENDCGGVFDGNSVFSDADPGL
jgi:hypothetical protein